MENAAYSQQFDDPNFKRHNGIDATNYGNAQYGQNWPVYCPVEGFTVENVRWDPTGGGNELWLISNGKVLIGGMACYARLILCHGKKILVKPGDEPALGELLMIANNTGFSTGPHTHMGLYRLDDKKHKIDTNEATGSFDPSLCFSNSYAIDEAEEPILEKNGVRLEQYYRGG